MKKNKLLKIFGIMLLFVVFLTWIIPAGNYSMGQFEMGKTSPLGLFDIVKLPFSTIANFIHYSMVILLIGGLYGVINKTGAYSKLVDSIVDKNKNQERRFLVITTVIFALLSSLTGLNLVLFVFVPFFITILMSMKFDKKTVLLSTVGAILVGSIASTYGFNFNGYLNYYFGLDINSDMITKFIYLIIVTFLLITYILKYSKMNIKKTTEEKGEVKESKKDYIPLYTKTKSVRSFVPLTAVMITTLVLLVLGMYNWYHAFNTEFFSNIHESVMGVEIFGYPIIANILGTVNPLGNWNIYEISIVLVLATLLIIWLYSIKFKDAFSAFVDGMKEMLKPAIYVALANIIFHIIIISQANANVFYTIADSILSLTKEFNAATMGIFSIMSSFFFNDFTYLIGSMSQNITSIYTNAAIYPVIGLIIRSIFGIAMMILPTSMLLIGGLVYLDIPYKEWVKYIWKYLLQILGITAIIVTILVIII